MMNCLPVFSIAAIMLSAAERSAANGFSSKTCTLYGATLSTQSHGLLLRGKDHEIGTGLLQALPVIVKTRSAGMVKSAIAEAILSLYMSQTPAISTSGCSWHCRKRSPMWE